MENVVDPPKNKNNEKIQVQPSHIASARLPVDTLSRKMTQESSQRIINPSCVLMSQASTINIPMGRGRGRPPSRGKCQKLLRKRQLNHEEDFQTGDALTGPGDEEKCKRLKLDS